MALVRHTVREVLVLARLVGGNRVGNSLAALGLAVMTAIASTADLLWSKNKTRRKSLSFTPPLNMDCKLASRDGREFWVRCRRFLAATACADSLDDPVRSEAAAAIRDAKWTRNEDRYRCPIGSPIRFLICGYRSLHTHRLPERVGEPRIPPCTRPRAMTSA